MKYLKLLCFSFTLFFVLTGCKDEKIDPLIGYTITGKVVNIHGIGVNNVRINIGENEFVMSDGDGDWQAINLQGSILVVPADSGYLFSPDSVIVTTATNQTNFIARQKRIPSMIPENILAWLIQMQLPNGLIETGEQSNLVSLYDNSLAALTFLATGEQSKAEKIFDFFDQRVDIELLSGKGGFSQFRDANGIPTGHNWLGDNAWMLIALNNYAAMVDETKYQRLTDELAKWITGLQDTDGGIWGGYTANGLQIGKITEGMIDAFNAVPGYTAFHHDLLEYFSIYRWDSTQNLLVSWPGNYYEFALDNHSWGYCGIEDFPYAVLEKTDRYINTQTATIGGMPVTGFAPDIDKDVVWLEGTGQMVIAYQKAGKFELADFYLQEMVKPVINNTAFAGTKSLPYSSNFGTGYGAEPFWTGVNTNPSTSPCTWFLMAMLQFDPLAQGYFKNIPLEDKFWLP